MEKNSSSTKIPPHQSSLGPSPLSSSNKTRPGLTSVHLFLSYRCTLGDSRVAGAQAVQIPPSPAWCVEEGLGVRTCSPEAPEGLRLSAQGPTAGEQAGQQAWFVGIQFLGSQTPLASTFSDPAPPQRSSVLAPPLAEPVPSLTLPQPRTNSSSSPAHLL